MSRDLVVEITDWLAANPEGGSASEIAAGIAARRFDVSRTLRGYDGFRGPERVGASPHTRQVWRIATNRAGRAGTRNVWPRVQPGSHNARILTVLADRRWHSSREIHSRVFCILHSRIAELRARGYVIEHRGDGFGAEFHEYRLAAVPADERAAA